MLSDHERAGAAAIFGNGGTGGTVTLGGATSVASFTFNSFTGTYTLGNSANAITLNKGVVKNAGSSSVSIASPMVLGAAQTWSNLSSSAFSAGSTVNNGGFNLTVDGSGPTNLNLGILSGTGGLVKNGSGTLILGSGSTPAHTYSGPTTVNGGVVMFNANKTTGNMTLNNGMLTDYYRTTTSFSGGLGTGNNQIQIYGDSGFGGGNGTSIWRIGTAGSVLTWGSSHFNPTTLKFLTAADNMGPTIYGQVTFDNGLNLNGAARTISVLAASGPNAITSSWARINGVISGSTGSLIKTGGGNLILGGANSYGGGTTVQSGMLQLANAAGLGSTSGPLTVNGGLLHLNDLNIAVGNLTGTGGTIANNASNLRTLTIGSGNGDGGIYHGVIANRTGTGTGTLALTKTGTGTITLAGLNTYSGATVINGGTLMLTGATQATSAITFAADSSLGLVIGSPVTASGAAVNFANGKISVTGTPGSSSQVLLTALSFTGTPVLATAIPGYELAVAGNQLLLNQVVTDPYAAWSGGADFGADANNDGLDNGLAWLLGAPDKDAAAVQWLPGFDSTTDPAYFIFTYRRADSAHLDPNTVIAVEYSTGLSAWTTAVDNADIDIIETDNHYSASPGVDRVQVKLKRSTLGSGGELFARLKVLKNP